MPLHPSPQPRALSQLLTENSALSRGSLEHFLRFWPSWLSASSSLRSCNFCFCPSSRPVRDFIPEPRRAPVPSECCMKPKVWPKTCTKWNHIEYNIGCSFMVWLHVFFGNPRPCSCPNAQESGHGAYYGCAGCRRHRPACVILLCPQRESWGILATVQRVCGRRTVSVVRKP